MLFADTEGVMKACFIKERIIPSQTQGLRLGMQLKGVIGVLLLIHPREWCRESSYHILQFDSSFDPGEHLMVVLAIRPDKRVPINWSLRPYYTC